MSPSLLALNAEFFATGGDVPLALPRMPQICLTIQMQVYPLPLILLLKGYQLLCIFSNPSCGVYFKSQVVCLKSFLMAPIETHSPKSL